MSRGRLLVLLTVGALTLVTAATVGVIGSRPHEWARAVPEPDPYTVPWLDLPATEHPEPERTPRPDASPCRAVDLAFDRVNGARAGEHHLDSLGFRNVGATRCTLSGRPVLLGRNVTTGATGALRVSTRTAITPSTDQMPATIDPGEVAEVTIETYETCPNADAETTYDALRLRLPRDAGELALDDSIDATCGVSMTPWYRRPVPRNVYDPLARLIVSIEAPRQAAVGTSLEFVVVLTNPTGEDLALNPCPNYSMWLAGPLKVFRAHRLNCTVPAVPAGGTVRFAMRLEVPDVPGQVGPRSINWTLDANGPDGPPTAYAPLTVTE
jgi:hypothetical protein